MDRILAFTCEMAIESFVEYDMDAAMEAGLGDKIGNIVAMAKKAILALLAKIRNGIRTILNVLRKKSSGSKPAAAEGTPTANKDKAVTITRRTDLAFQYLHDVVSLLKKMPKLDAFVRESTRRDYVDDLADIRIKMNNVVKKIEGVNSDEITVGSPESRTNKTVESVYNDLQTMEDTIRTMEREIKFSAYGSADTSRLRRDKMLHNEEYMGMTREHLHDMTTVASEMQRIVGLASQACAIIFKMVAKDESTASTNK